MEQGLSYPSQLAIAKPTKNGMLNSIAMKKMPQVGPKNISE
jgi:hypothetical protein